MSSPILNAGFDSFPIARQNIEHKVGCLVGFSIPGLDALQEQYDSMQVDREDEVAAYYKVDQQLNKCRSELRDFIFKPQYVVPFLQAGRMIRVRNKEDDFGWGIVINYKNKRVQGKVSKLVSSSRALTDRFS